MLTVFTPNPRLMDILIILDFPTFLKFSKMLSWKNNQYLKKKAKY